MRTVASTKTGFVVGVTVGLRKDGSVAVLFDDADVIKWYSAAEFNLSFKAV